MIGTVPDVDTVSPFEGRVISTPTGVGAGGVVAGGVVGAVVGGVAAGADAVLVVRKVVDLDTFTCVLPAGGIA